MCFLSSDTRQNVYRRGQCKGVTDLVNGLVYSLKEMSIREPCGQFLGSMISIKHIYRNDYQRPLRY